MLKHDDKMKKVQVSNGKMSFVISYKDGLKLEAVEYHSDVPWLQDQVDFFYVMKIL